MLYVYLPTSPVMRRTTSARRRGTESLSSTCLTHSSFSREHAAGCTCMALYARRRTHPICTKDSVADITDRDESVKGICILVGGGIVPCVQAEVGVKIEEISYKRKSILNEVLHEWERRFSLISGCKIIFFRSNEATIIKLSFLLPCSSNLSGVFAFWSAFNFSPINIHQFSYGVLWVKWSET